MRPTLLGSLSAEEHQIEERLRTLALCICAGGVIGYALYTLRSVLVPLVLAIALTYLLQPLIDLLSLRPLRCCGRSWCSQPPDSLRTVRPCLRPFAECVLQLKLPRWLAVCLALAFAFGVLGLLGFVVADSIHIFSKRADVYSERVQQLTFSASVMMDRMRTEWIEQMGSMTGGDASTPSTGVAAGEANATDVGHAPDDDSTAVAASLAKLAGKLPVTELIMKSLASMMEALSNLALVLLFAVYLLLGSSPKPQPPVGLLATPTDRQASVDAQADAQINTYIKGKVSMSLLVGALTALSLGLLQVDLWLVFGLLAFWLNFIPNVGTVLAVALPMPLVVLDPAFSGAGIAMALLLPLSAHGFAGSVLEPLMFGATLKLHPVVVLLSLLLWGAVWGVTGMVLAVPITAVLRIRLSHIKHPLPQYVANLLVGEAEPPTAAGSPLLSVTSGSGDGGASGRGGHGDDDDAASSSGLLGHSVEMEAREADAHARRGSARSHQPLEAALEHDIETESAGNGAAVDGRQGLGR